MSSEPVRMEMEYFLPSVIIMVAQKVYAMICILMQMERLPKERRSF
jgi:hypothetical protein